VAPRLLIAGGTGVFGRLLARRVLDLTDAEIVIASRDLARADAEVRRLASARAHPVVVDLAARRSFERAATGCAAVVCAAGPFQRLPPDLPAWAIAVGAHWVDIADDPRWILRLVDDERVASAARAAGVVVAPGHSTTPAVSGALVEIAAAAVPAPRAARISLFIGNRNAKGAGVLSSAIARRLRPSGRATLPIAGRRVLFATSSADDALVRRRLGIPAAFFVAPEFAVGARLLRVAPDRPEVERLIARLAPVVSGFGTSRGAVEVEVRGEDVSVVASVSDGQSVAIEPCALAVTEILAGRVASGVHAPAEVESPDRLLGLLEANGFRVAMPRPGHW